MMTVDGLFGAGDTIGGTAHKFSSGSFIEGRISAKAAVKYISNMSNGTPKVDEAEYENLKTVVYKPLENQEVGRNEIVAGTVSSSYLLPINGLQRLEKIMDEHVGVISTNYMTNEWGLKRGLELLCMMQEDMAKIGAEDLHQFQRAWELQHRLTASLSVTHHTLFREETRWPGYYYRGDHMKLDDENWHVFTLSQYDRASGEWKMEKAPGLSHRRLIGVIQFGITLPTGGAGCLDRPRSVLAFQRRSCPCRGRLPGASAKWNRPKPGHMDATRPLAEADQDLPTIVA